MSVVVQVSDLSAARISATFASIGGSPFCRSRSASRAMILCASPPHAQLCTGSQTRAAGTKQKIAEKSRKRVIASVESNACVARPVPMLDHCEPCALWALVRATQDERGSHPREPNPLGRALLRIAVAANGSAETALPVGVSGRRARNLPTQQLSCVVPVAPGIGCSGEPCGDIGRSLTCSVRYPPRRTGFPIDGEQAGDRWPNLASRR